MRQSSSKIVVRPQVCLVGANMQDRATICRRAFGERMHVEAIPSIAELTPPVVAGVDVFLVRDHDNLIDQLKTHLLILAHPAPIIAIAERPSVRQIAKALLSGALDFLEWPSSSESVLAAVTSAMQTTAALRPLRQRAIEARRRLERLSKRERQVLTAMAQGMSNKTIAELLEITPAIVDGHRRDLLAKIEADHSAEAIRLELEASLTADWNRQSEWMAPWLLEAALKTGS